LVAAPPDCRHIFPPPPTMLSIALLAVRPIDPTNLS
jgi:hypothetical protein